MFRELHAALHSWIRVNKGNIEAEHPQDGYVEVNGLKAVVLTTAIEAGVTATALAAGSFAVTKHATGRGGIFVSDGAVLQDKLAGFSRSNGSTVFSDFIARPVISTAIDSNGELAFDKDAGISAFRITEVDSSPLFMGSIYDNGGSGNRWEDGDEISVINAATLPIRLRRENSGGSGPGLRWFYPYDTGGDLFDCLTWPAGAEILFRYDVNQGTFLVMPRFTPSEVRFGSISGNTEINSDTFEQYHGQMHHVVAAADITVTGDVPEGFTCDFVQTTSTSDSVTFVGNSLTLQNRAGDNAINGQWGVVSVLVRNGNLILFGDTKTI